MTCRGHIHKGAIVLDRPTDLPDGTEVEVEVKAVGHRPVGQEKIEALTEGIRYDFEAVERLREASKP
jgi:hypothetical protein